MASNSTAPPTAAALRTALLIRCGENQPPGAWRSAAAAVSISGADAFLCHLSRSITVALERLAVFVEAARSQLLSAREDICVEDELHAGDLNASIATAEACKRAALERELCAVDVALERFRIERGAALEAAAAMSDAELIALYPELTARLDAAEALLLALPTAAVEPPLVELILDEAVLFGRVVAPLAVTAADLTLEGALGYALPGGTHVLRLVLLQSDALTSQSVEELTVSLGAAAAATHVEATLEAEGAALQPLRADAIADVPGRCVSISIGVPHEAPVGSSVSFSSLTVFGQPVSGLPGPLVIEPPGPADLTPEHAAQLQAWLPPGGGSCSPSAWEEVYRATTHGFGTAAFHTRCDGRARLLVLVRAWEGGWLFGGFTAVGFIPGPERTYADPSAFLFSLTNALGRPEKLDSLQTGNDISYSLDWSATFGRDFDFYVCDGADSHFYSYTDTGYAFAASASTGPHPMARQFQSNWLAAEVVAWVV